MAAFVVRLAEHLVPLIVKYGSFGEAVARLLDEVVWPRFWIIYIWLSVLLFVYCALRELIRAIGRDQVVRLFFGSGSADEQQGNCRRRDRLVVVGVLARLSPCSARMRRFVLRACGGRRPPVRELTVFLAQTCEQLPSSPRRRIWSQRSRELGDDDAKPLSYHDTHLISIRFITIVWQIAIIAMHDLAMFMFTARQVNRIQAALDNDRPYIGRETRLTAVLWGRRNSW